MESNLVMEAIKERRSIRKFRPEMPTEEEIGKIVEAGLYAASGRDRQTAKIIVIRNEAMRKRFEKVNAGIWGKDTDPFYGAPLILLVIAEKGEPNHVYDGSLVLGNMMLAAHALGLGSCWINRAREEFERDDFKNILTDLGLKGEFEGIGHLAVGYIDGEAPDARKRRENRVFYID